MRIKNAKLEWYAFRWNDNKNKLEWINVLGRNLKEDIYREVSKKHIYDYSGLKDYIKTNLMYYYWSKCEYEVAVCDLFEVSKEDAIKLDVFSQLYPNLDRITEYVINEMKIDFKEGVENAE